jgi:hypothetical protein
METRNKILIFIFALIFLLSDVCAIRINEVEMNSINGNEWVELYNNAEEDIDISGWEIWEGVYGLSGPKRILVINNTIIPKKEFYITEWNSSKLNDNGDFVILYDNSQSKINETPMLEDKEKFGYTNQFCSSEWRFVNSTKGQENNCVVEQTTEQQPPEENLSEEQETNETVESTEPDEYHYNPPKATTEAITLEPIALNIKSEENKEILKKNLAIAGIVSFCLGFGALFFLKAARRRKENEFR